MPSPLKGLTANWQLKLLALALAVLLWVVVSAEQVTSQWIPVPLQIRETDPDFQHIANDLPAEVEVRFTGSGRDLVDVAIRKPPLVLSIPSVESTTQDFRLEASMVQIPSQLNVNAQEVRNPLVRLSFRRLTARTLPVEPVVDEMASEWTLVDTLRIMPRQVEVRGPAERVETIERIRTVPFALPASDSLFTSIIQLDTTDLGGVDLSVRQVRVSGRIDRMVQRRLTDVPISVGAGALVRPTTVNVTLSGPRSVVERVGANDFRVVISIDSIPAFLPPAGISVPVRVEQLRRGLRASVAPAAVRLLPPAGPSEAAPDSSEASAADAASIGAGERR